MSFFTSLSGLKAAQSDLSVISNNVANVGSIGFKKSRAEFGDLISASPLQSGTVAGQGTRLKEISQQFTQGGFKTSDRALDLAISGQGFFVTRTGSQMSFTRNGSFSIDENRNLIDSNGNFQDAYALQRGDWVLVRPDGYIGAIVASDNLDAIEEYLQRVGMVE